MIKGIKRLDSGKKATRKRITRVVGKQRIHPLHEDLPMYFKECTRIHTPRHFFSRVEAHKYANKLVLRWLERSRKEVREWNHKRKWMYRFLYKSNEAQALAQAS